MKYIISLIFSCVLSTCLPAQTKVVTVLDAVGKVPLEGVKVTFANGKIASTDAAGGITVKTGDVLELTYIGYAPITVAADTVTQAVTLQPDTYQLDGVAINTKKGKKHIAKLLPKEGMRSLIPKNYGTSAALSHTEEMAVYIPAAIAKNGAVVKKIFFEPTDYTTFEDGKHIKHPGAKYLLS